MTVKVDRSLERKIRELPRPYQKWWQDELAAIDQQIWEEFRVEVDMIDFASEEIQDSYAVKFNEAAQDILDSVESDPFDADPYPMDEHSQGDEFLALPENAQVGDQDPAESDEEDLPEAE